MDDRTTALLVFLVVLATGLLLLDASAHDFELPGGFWTFLTAVVGLMAGRAYFKGKGNGSGVDE